MKFRTVGFRSIVLSMLLFCSSSFGSLAHFYVNVADPVIPIGGETNVEIWVWAEGAQADGGIILWGVDVVLPEADDGIVQLSTNLPNLTFIEPVAGFYSTTGALDTDNPWSGTVKHLSAESSQPISPLGVGLGHLGDVNDLSNYTKIAEVKIEGLSVGTAHYSLGLDYAGDFLAALTDLTWLDGVCESQLGQTSVTVVPEPATLLMLGLAGMCLRKRK